ncbi:FHA domain-containing protein, partial [Nocardioides stalactiti]|uniref:FHA domain-containing protein n=1 Tax=Nocardioides stalactiti TaxID=2755356 RepID=UPI0016045160
PAAARASIVTPRPPTAEEVSTAFAATPNETVHIADSIAALHADDGTRVPLDRDYVLGRDPRQDPTVVRGVAAPVQVDDGEQLISRIHAYVSVHGDGVTVRDAGSANGTFVAAPGAAAWTRIGPDPTPVPVGHSLRLGLRVYTHVPAEVPDV